MKKGGFSPLFQILYKGSDVLPTTKERLDGFFDRFFHGVGFPVVVMLTVLFGHSVPIFDLPSFIFLSVLAAIGLLRYRTVNVMLPMAFMAFYVVNGAHSPNFPHFNDYYQQPLSIAMIAVGGVILFGSLFYYCYRNRSRANRFTKTTATVGISFAVLAGAFLLNGIGSSYFIFGDVLYGAALSVSFLFFYFLFVRYLDYTEELKTLVMQNMVLTELLISFEVFLIYLTNDKIFQDGEIMKGELMTGWGTWGSIGCMLVMMLPACFYLAAIKKNGILYFIAGLVGFGATILSMSRSAWLVGCGIFALSLLFYCLFSPYRRRALLSTLFVVLVGLVALILLREKLFEMFLTNIELGIADNGRFSIWEHGMNCFQSFPILGAGFYSNEAPEGWTLILAPALYHNTFVQMLASCGIVGFLVYLYHRGVTLYYALKRLTVFRLFLILSVAALLLATLVDNFLFMIFPTIAYGTLLAVGAMEADHASEEDIAAVSRYYPRRKKQPSDNAKM